MQERQGGIKNLLARIGRAWAAVHDRRQARRVGLFWLAGAAVLHVGCAVAVLLAGRWGVAPALVDAAGIVGGAAADSHDYVRTAATLAQRLTHEGIGAWVGAPAPLHVKLYSLSFALAAHLSGETILSAEPLNLLLYLLLVYLAHRLGTEAFGARAGWFAAAALALWPSLLLHTTQLLKDSCYLIAILALALLVSRWLTRVFGWRAALWNAAGCAGVIAFAGALRHATGGATLVCVAFGGGLLLLRQRRARQWLAGNSCAALLVALVVAVGAARGAARFRELRPVVVRSSATQTLEAERGASPSGAASANCLTRARARLDLDAARLGRLRRAFAAGYSGSGSTIDGGCTFDDAGDVLRYVPRALAVGWFAPFPGDWMQTGAKFGAAGRRISGLEMLLLYGVELLACFGLWQERRNLCAWLLFLSGAFGLLALGLVVANAGALYRLRYAPFALLVVVAAGGWRAAMDAGPSRKFVRLMNRTFSGRIRRG